MPPKKTESPFKLEREKPLTDEEKKVLKMYEISGQDPITKHSHLRYTKDRAQDTLLGKLAENSPDTFARKISYANPKEKLLLIRQGLKHSNIQIQKVATESTRFIPDDLKFFFEKKILENVMKGLKSSNFDTRKLALQMIEWIPEKERTTLISLGLTDPNIEVQKTACIMIISAPKNEQAALEDLAQEKVRLGLENPDIKIQKTATEILGYLPKKSKDSFENTILEKVRTGLKSSDTDGQKTALQMVSATPEKERAELIKQGLENSNPEVYKAAVEAIRFAPENEIVALIKQEVEKTSTETEIQKLLVNLLYYVPESLRSELIKWGLENTNVSIQRIGARMTYFAPQKEIISLFELGLEIPDALVNEKILFVISQGPENDRAMLVEKGLVYPDLEVRNAAIRAVHYVPHDKAAALLKKGLEDTNPLIQRAAVRAISGCGISASEEDSLKKVVLNMVEQNLKNPDSNVQKIAIEMLEEVPNEDKERICDFIIKNGLGEELVKSPLYGNENIDSNVFSRQSFVKTGSETTLLGGSLKNKTIIRHITPEAFLCWQKAYTDYSLWENAGFDYVPIEPIQSYKINKNELVDVYSGVLDVDLMRWEERTGKFTDELIEQQKKIHIKDN